MTKNIPVLKGLEMLNQHFVISIKLTLETHYVIEYLNLSKRSSCSMLVAPQKNFIKLFLEIVLHNFKKILKKCFLVTGSSNEQAIVKLLTQQSSVVMGLHFLN